MKKLTLKDINEITDIKTFLNFAKDFEEEINEYIIISTGLSHKSLDELSTSEKRFLEYSNIRDFIINNLAVIVNSTKNFKLEDVSNYFFTEPYFDFFQIISQTKDKVTVEEISSAEIKTFYKERNFYFPDEKVIYGMIFEKDDSYFLHNEFVQLYVDEIEKLYSIYEDLYADDGRSFFLDLIIIKRILQRYVEIVNELEQTYGPYLEMKFDEDSLENFYKHFNLLSKYMFYAESGSNIYDLDYYKFLIDQCESGNFIIDGELENFIDILADVMNLASEDFGYEVAALKYIKLAQTNIFMLRKILNEGYQFTDFDLIDDILGLMRTKFSSLAQLQKLNFFMGTLPEFENLKLTSVTKKLRSITVKNYIEGYFSIVLSESEEVINRTKLLVEFAFSTLVANGLLLVTDEGIVHPTGRLYFFMSEVPEIRMANIFRSAFSPKTFAHYFSTNLKEGEKILKKTQEAIREENFYDFGKTQREKNIILILEALNVLAEKEINGEKFYKLEDLGLLIQKRLTKKIPKAKVLKLGEYKK